MMPLETSGSTPLSPESNLDQRLTVSHPVIDAWLRAVNAHSVDAVCSLYAPEAILLPTLSDVIRDTPDRIRDYFESFLNRKNLSATLRNCYVQEYSEIKIDSGIYEFKWESDTMGLMQFARARFTFVIREEQIVEHHSSMASKFPE